ncbi:ADP compounds hydrolase NudE [Thiomicrospira microaerophila]|uniref:ADP compounds hydrolase NudE n=1 Tax=Thiomicrospira microaerophila TaxID=406020 RepID=UPI00200E4DC8|nr:ADP compounds hydrolase NudE [Thiomicrospira microaerophila]UQB41500.1 ADP compounds hydrolase NudE [Thiomicrospira microaerophila]
MEIKKLPNILSENIVVKSRIFTVQAQKLEFSNGTQVDYERLIGHPDGAVLIVPMLDEDTLLLIREYSAGVGRYELGFPKGKIDPGETWLDACQRECIEEIGYRPQRVDYLDKVCLAAGYMDHHTHLVLVRDLMPEQAEGDEPEPLEVVPWKLSDWPALLAQASFSEGRAYAALFLMLQKLGKI